MVLALSSVLSHGQFMRLLAWSRSESCCDPHLGPWVYLIFLLLPNFRTDIARCVDQWRKRNLRVLLSFQASLAYVPDLRLNGDVRLLLDL